MARVLFVYGSILFANRVKNWERGAPDARATTPATAPKRLADFRAGVYMQTLLRDPAAGIMHSLIYFSFLILFAVLSLPPAPLPKAHAATGQVSMRSVCTAQTPTANATRFRGWTNGVRAGLLGIGKSGGLQNCARAVEAAASADPPVTSPFNKLRLVGIPSFPPDNRI